MEDLRSENLIGVNELAEFLGVPKSRIYSRSRETGPETIPRLHVGKYVKFQLPEVMDWLKEKNEVNHVEHGRGNMHRISKWVHVSRGIRRRFGGRH